MANTITPTTAKAYFLTDGTVRDNYGDTLFHPLSNINNIEIYVEDGDSDNVMTINYNPAIRKKWATHWFPCFYRGLVEHTLDGESEPRSFAQYLTTMPSILSTMNQNSETSMGVTSTLRQQAGSNLIGSYANIGALPTSYGDWTSLEEMEENDVVAYVYSGANGFYMVEYVVDTYVWTLQTSGISNYVYTKQYDTWELSIQGGFGNPAEITELTDQQYVLIWQELSLLSAYYDSNYDLIQDLIDGTTPAGKAVADQNGNVINTTYQLLSNLVTAFQVTPDDTHYASEKLIYDTIQNILNGTTPFTAMTLYNANGNAIFTIDDEGVLRAVYSGISHEIGENLFVRGDEVGTILNGDTIMFDGSIGASGKMNVVTITSANIATLIANPHYFLGIATQAFSGIQNRLNWYGGVSDLNTISYTSNVPYPSGEGKVVYVDMVNGGVTYIRPAKPLPVIEIGAVVTYHATQGRLLVRPHFSQALGDLHDVDLNGGTTAGDVIIRNAMNTKFEAFNLTQALIDAVAVNDAKLLLKEDKANKSVAGGYASLNSLGIVPSEQLPSYIDNIVEYDTYADLPAIGVENRIYVVIEDETSGGNTSQYRWSGTVYVMISNTMSAAEIKALYESNDDTNEFDNSEKTKLGTVETGATADQSDVEIKTAYENNADTNAYTDAEKSKVANTPSDTVTELLGKMSKTDYASNGEAGVVDESVLSRTAQQTLVVPLTKGTLGKFFATVAGFSLILHNEIILLFPNSTTDLTENVEVSLSGVGGTYKYLKYDDTLNNVVVKHTQDLQTEVSYDGTEWFMKGETLVSQEITYDESIVSTYGDVKPIKGQAQMNEVNGLMLNQLLLYGDFRSSTGWTNLVQWTIGSGVASYDATANGYMQTSIEIIAGQKYAVSLDVSNGGGASRLLFTDGTGATLFDETTAYLTLANGKFVAVYTASVTTSLVRVYSITSGGTFDLDNLMFIPLNNTPLYAHTTSQLSNMNIDYFEGTDYITDFEMQSIGVNGFNKNNVTVGYYVNPATGELSPSAPSNASDYIGITSSNIYIKGTPTSIITGGKNSVSFYTANKTWISHYAFLLTGESISVPTGARFARFSVFPADLETAILVYGTTEPVYVEYNSPTNFALKSKDETYLHLLSVGTSIRDKAYELNGVWYKDNYVGVIEDVAIGDVIDTTAIPLILETTGVFHAYDTVNNEEQYGVYGDTLTLTGTATVYYQLADIVQEEILKDGSIIQEANTTLIQVGNFATKVIVEFACNANALLSTLNDKIIYLQTMLDKVEEPQWTDLRTPLTPAQINPTNSKPDFDYTNIGLLFPQNDTSEYIVASFQMPHSYKEGSDIDPHIHLGQALDLQAVFKIEYKWVNIGDTLPGTWTTITLDTYAITYVSGTLHQLLSASAHIDGTGMKISSIFKVKLYRDDNVYTGDILVSDLDIHYREDTNGSVAEYVK